jgi:hypothetical protein
MARLACLSGRTMLHNSTRLGEVNLLRVGIAPGVRGETLSVADVVRLEFACLVGHAETQRAIAAVQRPTQRAIA